MHLHRLMQQGNAPLYVVGLSPEDLPRLQTGSPLLIHLEELGGQGTLMVLSSDNPAQLRAELAGYGLAPPRQSG